MKKCSRCKKVQSRRDFSRRLGSRDGLQPWCKSCGKEVASTYRPQWRLRNRETIREYSRQWKRDHPDRVRSDIRKRRAARKGVDIESTLEYEQILSQDPCAYCGNPSSHIDHIVPLSAGGPHSWENLTAACQYCNLSKHTSSLLEYLL